MKELQDVPPDWLQWAWTSGLVVSLLLMVLTVVKEFSFIKRIVLLVSMPIRKVWVMITDRWFWFRNGLKIKVRKKPTSVVSKHIGGAIFLATTIIGLELSPRERMVNSNLDIEDLKVTIVQDRGKKKRKLILKPDVERYSGYRLSLQPGKECCIEIPLTGLMNTSIPNTVIIDGKQLRWRIDGIKANVWSLDKKISFSGHKYGLLSKLRTWKANWKKKLWGFL